MIKKRFFYSDHKKGPLGRNVESFLETDDFSDEGNFAPNVDSYRDKFKNDFFIVLSKKVLLQEMWITFDLLPEKAFFLVIKTTFA